MLPEPNTNPVRLARLRARKEQVALARETNRSVTTIRNAERGIASRKTLLAIAKALNVSIDELMGRKAAAP